ncbi:hypothetical protein [Brevundimonas sp.]|uniref:hypothetical protein n=1 Tax=Brevundimonas sp. TaxID=1871086 RepID=UPI0035B1933C
MLQAVVDRASRSLRKPALVVAIERLASGGFRTLWAINGLRRAEVEAAALDLLKALSDDLSGCPECEACKARTERVAVAIAALENRPESNPQGVH